MDMTMSDTLYSAVPLFKTSAWSATGWRRCPSPPRWLRHWLLCVCAGNV